VASQPGAVSDIAAHACHGESACEDAVRAWVGSIATNSCNADYACLAGSNAHVASSSVDTSSCNAEEACLIGYNTSIGDVTIGRDTCNVGSACEVSDSVTLGDIAIGNYSCNNATGDCQNNDDGIGDCELNDPQLLYCAIGDALGTSPHANALLHMLDGIQSATNGPAKTAMIGAFVKQVEALRGTYLTDEEADELIALAQAL
jgi:NDP-sugar pyrophosphorylase family protein